VSAALAPAPARHAREVGTSWHRHDAGAGGETTLEEVVSRAWEGLAVRAVAGCLVCGGAMTSPAGGAGRCRDCGSELA
jgi:tRNA(Ile2) C34 agmatinyltransferase TiaS